VSKLEIGFKEAPDRDYFRAFVNAAWNLRVSGDR
jgi:hypothetical protein